MRNSGDVKTSGFEWAHVLLSPPAVSAQKPLNSTVEYSERSGQNTRNVTRTLTLIPGQLIDWIMFDSRGILDLRSPSGREAISSNKGCCLPSGLSRGLLGNPGENSV